MNAHSGRLQRRGISLGKGVISYSRAEPIDFTVVELILHNAVKSTRPVC